MVKMIFVGKSSVDLEEQPARNKATVRSSEKPGSGRLEGRECARIHLQCRHFYIRDAEKHSARRVHTRAGEEDVS